MVASLRASAARRIEKSPQSYAHSRGCSSSKCLERAAQAIRPVVSWCCLAEDGAARDDAEQVETTKIADDVQLSDSAATGTFEAMSDEAPSTEPSQVADEGALIDALKQGDETAFETLIRDYGGPLLAVARRMLRNEADANDAVQDTFLSAFKSIDKFAGESQLSTWLHRIAVNASLMKLRTRRRKPEQQIDELLPQFLEDGHHASGVRQWRESVEEALDRKEMGERVRDSIDRLPDSHRTVLLLRDIEQHDTASTAELLGISEGAVKTRLHRARQALRDLLDPHLEGKAV